MSYLGDRLHPWRRSLLLSLNMLLVAETASWQPLDLPQQSYYRSKRVQDEQFSSTTRDTCRFAALQLGLSGPRNSSDLQPFLRRAALWT